MISQQNKISRVHCRRYLLYAKLWYLFFGLLLWNIVIVNHSEASSFLTWLLPHSPPTAIFKFKFNKSLRWNDLPLWLRTFTKTLIFGYLNGIHVYTTLIYNFVLVVPKGIYNGDIHFLVLKWVSRAHVTHLYFFNNNT